MYTYRRAYCVPYSALLLEKTKGGETLKSIKRLTRIKKTKFTKSNASNFSRLLQSPLLGRPAYFNPSSSSPLRSRFRRMYWGIYEVFFFEVSLRWYVVRERSVVFERWWLWHHFTVSRDSQDIPLASQWRPKSVFQYEYKTRLLLLLLVRL